MISIILPIYIANLDLLEMTCKLFLESLNRNYANNDQIELIVVDDNSPIEVNIESALTKYLDKSIRMIYVKNPKNLGFGISVNIGASYASGEYILISNNDIYITRNSIESLLKILLERNLGCLGPGLSDSHGYKAQLVKSPNFVNDYSNIDYAEIEKHAKDVSKSNNDSLISVNFLMGAFMILPKYIFDAIGGMEKIYGHGYYEEVDMQVKIRRLGYELAVARDVFILHQSKVHRSPTFISRGYFFRKYLLTKNALIFLLRNGLSENFKLNYDWFKRESWSPLPERTT